ncbi:hypothetical protein [Legionella sp. 29fVS95]|uniref:hypothetical protein n=1 Tax=Legionella sp. 29fVS95 TaxID=3402813 RepID=UPI003AF954E9
MEWLNKNQGALMLIGFLFFSVWGTYLTFKEDSREENKITHEATEITAKLKERVSHIQTDLEKTNIAIKEFEIKIFEIDKKVAVIEERLKNATTKSLIAAGASPEQALEFWESKSVFPAFRQIKIPKEKKQPYSIPYLDPKID